MEMTSKSVKYDGSHVPPFIGIPNRGPSADELPQAFVLAERGDVARLRRQLRSLGSVTLHIESAALADNERRRLERTLQRLSRACGCNEGALAGLLYIAVVLLFVCAGWWTLSFATIAKLGAGFVAVLLAGKLLGLAIARVRLLLVLQQLERAMRTNHEAS